MSIGVRVLSSTLIQIVGKIMTVAIALLSIALVTRYFSVSQLADYGTVFSILAIVSTLADMGVYTITLRQMGKHGGQSSWWYTAGVCTRMILIVGIFPILGLLFFLLPLYEQSYVPIGISIAMIGSAFALLAGMLSASLQHAMKIQYYTLSLVMGKAISLCFLYCITQYWYLTPSNTAFVAILLSGVVGSFCTLLMTWFSARKYILYDAQFSFATLVQILQPSFPIGISALFSMAYLQMGMMSFRIIFPDTLSAWAESHYFIIMRMMEVAMVLPIFFMNSFLAPLSESYQNQKAEFAHTITLSITLLSLLAFPVSFVCIALAPQIITVLAPHQALASSTPFMILLAGMWFAFINILVNYIFTIMHRERMVLWRSGISFVIGMLLTFFLVPSLVMVGAAIATLLTEVLVMLWGIWNLKKIVYFSIDGKALMMILSASGCIGIGIFFTKNIVMQSVGLYSMMALELIFSGVLFFGILFLIGFFTPDLKKIFSK